LSFFIFIKTSTESEGGYFPFNNVLKSKLRHSITQQTTLI
jgi:hypothetical protein